MISYYFNNIKPSPDKRPAAAQAPVDLLGEFRMTAKKSRSVKRAIDDIKYHYTFLSSPLRAMFNVRGSPRKSSPAKPDLNESRKTSFAERTPAREQTPPRTTQTAAMLLTSGMRRRKEEKRSPRDRMRLELDQLFARSPPPKSRPQTGREIAPMARTSPSKGQPLLMQHFSLSFVNKAKNALATASQPEIDQLPAGYVGSLIKLRAALQDKFSGCAFHS